MPGVKNVTVHSVHSNTLRDAKKYEPPCTKHKEYRLLRKLNLC